MSDASVRYVVLVRAAVEVLVGPFDTIDDAMEYAADGRGSILLVFDTKLSPRQIIELTRDELAELVRSLD